MQIPLRQLAGPRRRKRVTLRPIAPTQALEGDLFAIYATSLTIWTTLAAELARIYIEPGPVTDATPQIDNLIDAAARNADQVKFYQTERLGRWVSRVGEWHGAKTISSVRSALGIDISPYVHLSDVRDLLDDAIRQNVALISSVNADTRTRVEQIVADAFVNRRTKKEFTTALAKAMGITKVRARIIASDQIYKLNIAMTAYRNQQMGIEFYQWDHTPQKHPRIEHVRRDGKLFRWDAPPPDGPPGFAINCFPGSTEVDAANGCNKLWRRFYEGPISLVSTVSGGLLKATPNHPILTLRGWVAINEIEEGDYLVKRIDPGVIGQNDKDHFVSRFDDFFRSLDAATGRVPASGSKFDFHGDGTENNIDQINVNRFLWRDIRMHGLKRVDNFNLAGAMHNLSGSSFYVLGRAKSHFSEMLGRKAAHGLMSGGSSGGSFLRRHSSVHDESRVPSSSDGNFASDQTSRYLTPLQVKTPRNTDDALSGKIGNLDRIIWQLGSVVRWIFWINDVRTPNADSLPERIRAAREQGSGVCKIGTGLYQFDRVVNKPISEFFSGHVYNLSNDAGWYLANGFVAHNCKCHAVPIVEFD